MEIKPTLQLGLELNKSKELSEISGVIVDTVKASRGAVINIINNQTTNDKDKIYLLQQENSKLLDTLSELKDEIKKIENEVNYNHYYLHLWKQDIHAIKFEKILNSKDVKNYFRKMPNKGWHVDYYVRKDDWWKFVECIEEYDKWTKS